MKVLNYEGLQLYHELATEKFADAQTTLTNFQIINDRLASVGDAMEPIDDETIDSIIGNTPTTN